jgi:hypothetical protein
VQLYVGTRTQWITSSSTSRDSLVLRSLKTGSHLGERLSTYLGNMIVMTAADIFSILRIQVANGGLDSSFQNALAFQSEQSHSCFLDISLSSASTSKRNSSVHGTGATHGCARGQRLCPSPVRYC